MKTLEFHKKQANELLNNTFLTQICWEVSCDDKKFKENVIEICATEKEAKEVVTEMAQIGYNDLCYRPCVICKDEGVEVTKENLHFFHNGSDFVKQLRKDLKDYL
tara:strand:+ start:488 stop:802 length:315 start_codon:yes stop_codon:yes gene_type:complete